MTKAWIVISPVKPPADWGFKPTPWFSRWYRVTTNYQRAVLLKRDLDRLEIPRTKLKSLIITQF